MCVWVGGWAYPNERLVVPLVLEVEAVWGHVVIVHSVTKDLQRHSASRVVHQHTGNLLQGASLRVAVHPPPLSSSFHRKIPICGAQNLLQRSDSAPACWTCSFIQSFSVAGLQYHSASCEAVPVRLYL